MIFPKLLATGVALAMAVEAQAGGWLLVCNKGEQTLGIIDPVKGRQVAVIPEQGVTGHEVVASSDGALAFVPIYGNSGVGKPGTDGQLLRVVDLAKREIVATVDFGKGVRPHCAVIGPKNHQLYVTTEVENCVTEIDAKTFKILGKIPTGQAESHMLTISSDGQRGYTANVGPGTVSVLDMTGRKTVTIIPISKQTQRISISTDDKWVFTADQTAPRMALVDTAKNAVGGWIQLPATAYGTAPTPDGRWLVAALPGANQVAIIDLKKGAVAQTLDVPPAPQEVVLQADGALAYVSCDASHEIAVIDTKFWKVTKLINAGKGADGLAWAK
ncbi:MAG TPA: hypothetical protein VHB20_01770 [Verrucomicrobiae bacterium]|jgi:DNA-binding beta-propeller fold protein YncE|nr:hypothetical protein [Verrucomicrobiae bacterium]